MVRLLPANLANLQAAFGAERDAVERLHRVRAQLADLVVAAVKSGTAYDALARVGVRARHMRPAAPDERRREAQRLRQIVRRAANARHAKVPAHPVGSTSAAVALSEGGNMNNEPKLIRRTIEEFDTGDDALDGLDGARGLDNPCPAPAAGADDIDDADEHGEADEAPRKSR